MRRASLALLGVLAPLAAASASAEEMPTVTIQLKDGVISPLEVSVPAGRPFRIELDNIGASPVEFESLELRKEKVVAPQSRTTLVIRRLEAGTYQFFDDFHPDAPQAVLVAK